MIGDEKGTDRFDFGDTTDYNKDEFITKDLNELK